MTFSTLVIRVLFFVQYNIETNKTEAFYDITD